MKRGLTGLCFLMLLVSCGKTNNAHIKVNGSPVSNQVCSVNKLSTGAEVVCPDGSSVFIPNGTNGSSCSVEQLSNGAKVSCSDGTFAYIYNGKDGLDGKSCTVTSITSGAKISCEDGSIAYAMNGSNGQSCTVSDLANGALIQCGLTSAVIYDGEDGEDALSGAIGIAGYIRPCGNEFNNDEIFLRLTDGNILALYDGGPHEDRLVLLAPGNYITTDRNKNNTCHFTVTSDLQIINEVVN